MDYIIDIRFYSIIQIRYPVSISMLHGHCYNDRTPPIMMLCSDGYNHGIAVGCNENIYFNGIVMGILRNHTIIYYIQWAQKMFTSQWEHTRNGIVSWNASSWVIIDMDFNGIMKIWGFTFFFLGGEHVPKSDSKCFFQEISTTLKGIHIGLKSRLNIAKEP